MDRDLIAEIGRLQQLHERQGLYAFLCECQDCWLAAQQTSPWSPLFALSSPDGKLRMRRDGKPLGCPFTIKRSDFYRSPVLFAWTDEWTQGIRKDDRIPRCDAWLRPHHLIALAEWQQTFRDYFRGRRRGAAQRSSRRKAMLRRLAS